MELESYLTAFKTSLRVRLCVVLAEEELTINQILEKIQYKYKETKNRETIYRALEELVKYEIINKRYDQKMKKIVYNLKIKKAEFDFIKDNLIIKN